MEASDQTPPIQHILVIMAHPDDAEFCSGGVIKQHTDKGGTATYVVLTGGDKGNHDLGVTVSQVVEKRMEEQRRAAAVLGVKDVIFMGEEDGFLQPTRELRKRLVRIIRQLKPDVIICQNPEAYFRGDNYINHPDHRNAGLVAIEAIFPAADNPMFYPDMADEGYHPHKIKYLYVHGHDHPDLRVDITADLETKIEAILCHKSQFSEPHAAQQHWRESWAEVQEDGSRRYAEYFKIMRFG